MHHGFIHDTLHPTEMQLYWRELFKFVQMAFEAIFKSFEQMHKLRGSSTISLDLNDFIEYLVSLNCVVINHQKGEDCKCIWPPKWVLMLMTRTIKELMLLLSYEQDQKSLK